MSAFPHRLALASALVAGLSSVAAAQPGGAPPAGDPAPPSEETTEVPVPAVAPSPPPPIFVEVPPPVSSVDRGVLEDANSGRAWLAPTALTAPKGSWAFTDSELFLVGLTYGVTDTFQIGVGTMLPIVEDMPFLGTITAKAQVARSGRTRLAVHGTITHVSDDGDSGTGANVGGVGTLCLDADCHSTINGYVGTAFAISEDNGNQFPVLLSGSVVGRLNKHVKLVGEIDTGFVPGEDFENVYLGWYGVRFTSGTIAGDIGFVRPFGAEFDEDDNPLVLGLPWINFTYRAL